MKSNVECILSNEEIKIMLAYFVHDTISTHWYVPSSYGQILCNDMLLFYPFISVFVL